MADKLKIPKECEVILSKLSSKLDLKRNILCRIAISVSLSVNEKAPETDPDNSGQEFNRSTIMGADEFVFLAMIADHSSKQLDVNESFNTVVRDHIVSGLKKMDMIYDRVNSPVEFMKIIALKLKDEV